MELEINGQRVVLNDQGFLIDGSQWQAQVSIALAARDGVILTAAHWEILYFSREYYQRYKHLPNARVFVKAVRVTLGEEKGSSRYLQALFPESFLKSIFKFAGLPKPPTCL